MRTYFFLAAMVAIAKDSLAFVSVPSVALCGRSSVMVR